MKKNLFEISTDEVQRILSLHEGHTKNHYLSVINEQDTDQKYTIQSKEYILSNVNVGSNRLKLFKGTTFTKQGNKLVAKTSYQFVDWTGEPMKEPEVLVDLNGGAALANPNQVLKGTVFYYCSGANAGKYNVGEFKESFFYDNGGAKVLSVQLQQLCGGRIGKYTEQKGGAFKATNDKELIAKFGSNTLKVNPGTEINYINNQARVINNFNNYFLNFSCPNKFTAEASFDKTKTFPAQPGNAYTLSFFQNKFCSSKTKPVVQAKQEVVKPKSNFTSLYTIQYNHNLGKTQVNVGDTIIKSLKLPDYAAIMRVNTPIAYYNCKTNTWGDVQMTDTKGSLTKTLNEKICPQIIQPQTTTATGGQTTATGGGQTTSTGGGQTTSTGGGQTTSTGGGSKTNRRQQFMSNTVNGINQVQKTLGVAQPTGQLTNQDIDNILSKLGYTVPPAV